MITFYNPHHALYQGQMEMFRAYHVLPGPTFWVAYDLRDGRPSKDVIPYRLSCIS